MKEKPGSDVAKLSNNEAKLTAARQRLQEATSRLYKGFGYYDAIGGRLCQPEIEMLKKAQQDFFGAAMAAVRTQGCLHEKPRSCNRCHFLLRSLPAHTLVSYRKQMR